MGRAISTYMMRAIVAARRVAVCVDGMIPKPEDGIRVDVCDMLSGMVGWDKRFRVTIDQATHVRGLHNLWVDENGFVDWARSLVAARTGVALSDVQRARLAKYPEVLGYIAETNRVFQNAAGPTLLATGHWATQLFNNQH